MKKDQLPPIGTPIEGGFYAGSFQLKGMAYGLVVSPKSSGENAGASWGEHDLPDTHVADGFNNTRLMAAAGSQIALLAENLNIGIYNDWYIPSRDELELIYRNLKPGEQENYCTYRDGDNPSSLPSGLPYKADSPKQTNTLAFQAGGSEALEETWYWSSTQYSAHYAYIQDFSDGLQNGIHKSRTYRVRAVRRFIITN